MAAARGLAVAAARGSKKDPVVGVDTRTGPVVGAIATGFAVGAGVSITGVRSPV